MAGAAVALTLLTARPARADERQACASAAEQAQTLRDNGKYRQSREQLLICVRDVCPAIVKRDCVGWLNQLEAVTPTVVLSAKRNERDLVDVKVYLDGALVSEKLDGTPIPTDPGQHTFKFEWSGQTTEQNVMVTAGQKGRNIAASFGGDGAPAPGSPPDSAPSSDGRGSLVPAFLVGGLGLVGLTSFAILGISGRSDASELRSSCRPNCTQDQVDSVRRKLLIADISLGVGLVALGVSTYMILMRPKVSVDGNSVKTGGRLDVDFGPTAGGVAGSLGGRF
jgi:hypothetical protein